MYYYFCADFPSAIKLNGIYFGIISDTVKNININSLSEPTFLEVCPLNSEERTLNFLLDQKFLLSPPASVSVTDLKGGFLIKFLKTFSSGEFKVLGQEKFPDLLATVFNEKGVKISLETATDFFAEPIFYDVDNVTFNHLNLSPTLLAVGFSGKKTLLNVYDYSNKIQKVFSRVVDEYSFTNAFTTTENFLDMAKHKTLCEWQYENLVMTEKTRTVTKSERFNQSILSENLIPYAFMEELLVRGEISPYLTGSVKDNADKLLGFFGDFIGVMPPPAFRNVNEVGLIYNTDKNLYHVEYFTFELIDKKISGIKKVD